MRPEDAPQLPHAVCRSFGTTGGFSSPDHSPALHAPALIALGGIFAQLGDESRLAAGLPVYRKVKLLGRGAFGKAYLVEGTRGVRDDSDPTSPGGTLQKMRRVLKKLPLKGISEDQRESAFREALLMRKISRGCPYITQFNEVFLGKAGTILCLVMEFCSGGDLRTLIRGREGVKFPEENVLNWASHVGLALRHCHSHGVLHRDVKPENCFFRSAGGDLLLGDFGISCTLDEKSFAKTCVGSPLYLSPEIINQEKYSYATDAWSLGVMMYEMSMLCAPFKGTNICQVAFKIVSAIPEPIDASVYSEGLIHLIGRLLDKEAGTRATVEQALLSPVVAPWAEHASFRHGLEWPPPLGPGATSSSRSGLVAKLRSHFTSTNDMQHFGVVIDEYEEDFETAEPGDGDDEVVYDDDFEAASGGSEASYEQDFEDLSDDECEASNWEGLEGLEVNVRQQLQLDLGADGLAVAESLGVASFLERMRESAIGVAGVAY
eukprot:CAMPEP_0177166890 /NCGR_PEP_ID=MMETSP0367-20130122/8265_1 /TAXON_ID=447022 ORGANISM="Scrippsiella hangoei-like, Strain SHHI-4" /NCGR_SAMPLE_ID=MMETSP0367 /ASSEMBLY_ACC=CAM_ASM_000362 /LENGTH=489 /DNA_ID=CAMNT_0018612969 /DNA_START=11 /DNA_END=1480 /DNA_ORIENTATION=+